AWTVGSVSIPKLSVVTVVLTLVLVGALVLFLKFTDLGIQMRAAAENFRMARLMGVRANRVIAASFALSGALAGVAALVVLERTAVTMLIELVVVVGLYMFVGISGVFSFGHISFMAIGAYAAAILSIPVGTKSVIFGSMAGPLRGAHVPPLAAVFAGGAVAA